MIGWIRDRIAEWQWARDRDQLRRSLIAHHASRCYQIRGWLLAAQIDVSTAVGLIGVRGEPLTAYEEESLTRIVGLARTTLSLHAPTAPQVAESSSTRPETPS